MVFIVGALLLALAPTFACLLIGRLVVGVGVGVASMIVPVYVSKLVTIGNIYTYESSHPSYVNGNH